MSNKDGKENVEEVLTEVETVEETDKDQTVLDEEKTDEEVVERAEELIEDETLETEKEIEELDEAENTKESVKVDSNPSLFKKLFASLLDQALLLGVSALLLLVFDLVIGLFGYMVTLPTPILLIIFGIVNVLYYPLIERKGKRSIGKRILSIK